MPRAHRLRAGTPLKGVAVDRNGNFYMGSMDLGLIYKGTADDPTAAASGGPLSDTAVPEEATVGGSTGVA